MYHVSESCILLAHTRVNRASATNDFSPLLHVHSLDLVPEKNCIPQCDKKDFFLVNSFMQFLSKAQKATRDNGERNGLWKQTSYHTQEKVIVFLRY